MNTQTVYSWLESGGIRVKVEFNDDGGGRHVGYATGQFCAQVLVEGARATEYTERYSGDSPSDEKMKRVGSKALKQWREAVADGMVDLTPDGREPLRGPIPPSRKTKKVDRPYCFVE